MKKLILILLFVPFIPWLATLGQVAAAPGATANQPLLSPPSTLLVPAPVIIGFKAPVFAESVTLT